MWKIRNTNKHAYISTCTGLKTRYRKEKSIYEIVKKVYGNTNYKEKTNKNKYAQYSLPITKCPGEQEIHQDCLLRPQQRSHYLTFEMTDRGWCFFFFL